MKRYVLTYDFMGNEVVVDIDHSICTDELLHQINNFWSEADYRLSQADDNVLHAVLKMLCCRVLRSSVADWNAMDEFKVKGVEGWPLLDGSAGITLVNVDDWEFDEEEVSIKEQAA